GSLERLGIQALAGNDVIAVTTKDTVNAWVTADAGDPGANTPNGDVLRIIDGSGRGQLQNGPGGAITGSGSCIMNYAKTTVGQPRPSWRSPPLDATIYASPLIVGDRVYLATEANSVYALDAANGTVTWRAALGEPVAGADLPCGNIDPSGITGTPVIDVAA